MTIQTSSSILKYYNVPELSSLLGMACSTIRNYIKKGELEAIKVGRIYKISQEQINSFLKIPEVF